MEVILALVAIAVGLLLLVRADSEGGFSRRYVIIGISIIALITTIFFGLPALLDPGF